MTAVAYCYGLKAQNANPTPHEAPNFDQFVAQILALPRARSKETRTYICGPMRANGNGVAYRCKADLLPRVWLAKDLDGGSREEVAILLMRLSDYRGVAWTTLRHTPECPRLRIVLFLDRPVDGPEGERLGAGFTGVLGAGLPSLKWDRSTDHGEQACYLPMADAEVMHYNGDPINVDQVLALAPEEPLRARPATPDPYRALIIERGLFLREIGPGKDAIICPFEEEHSEQTSDSSTVYLWPLHGGYRWGRIYCSHTHCEGRQQEGYIRALGAGPPGVWRGQGRGEEPPIGEEPTYTRTRDPGVGGDNSERPASGMPGNGKDAAGSATNTGTEWPHPMDPCAYYGIAGEMVKAIEPHTESDTTALLVQILVAFGVLVGRTAYYPVEGDRHYSNLYLLLNGGTSKGRKGTSWGRVHSIFGRVPQWPRVVSGLSSGEGLKWQVRDKSIKLVKKRGEDEEVVDEGVADKRLLAIEPGIW